VDQGVLLLNTILTVPQGAAKGHAKLGWQRLVGQVLAHLADRPRAYILWGGPAHKMAATVDPAKNLKIESADQCVVAGTRPNPHKLGRPGGTMTQTILDKIKAYKLEEVAADKAAKPLEALAPLCPSAARSRARRLWVDRRDQESQSVQRVDPRGFRPRSPRRRL